jgi:hypothetical protein
MVGPSHYVFAATTSEGEVSVMGRRGFLAEINYQMQQAEKQRQREQAAASRAQQAADREVEKARREAERAQASASRATAQCPSLMICL